MSYRIGFTDDALRDLRDIDGYIAENDSPEKADAVVLRIEQAIATLSHSPHRGAHPPEALEFGDEECREIFFKPYRIIYEVSGQQVTILLISDGRRDMRALFQRRLLAP